MDGLTDGKWKTDIRGSQKVPMSPWQVSFEYCYPFGGGRKKYHMHYIDAHVVGLQHKFCINS